jgi:hypothetical protein
MLNILTVKEKVLERLLQDTIESIELDSETEFDAIASKADMFNLIYWIANYLRNRNFDSR